MDQRVDVFLEEHPLFSALLSKIRQLFLAAGLDETIKWGMPTYTLKGKNVVGLGAFKAHCGIWFFQGGLLKDTQQLLMNAQEGKTKAMRQWRFTVNSEFNEPLVRSYINEAIENERKGVRISPKRSPKPLVIAPQLEELITADKNLENRFNSLSLTNKRDFSEYILNAKRDETKTKRLEKIIPMILNNVGLNDKYKNC